MFTLCDIWCNHTALCHVIHFLDGFLSFFSVLSRTNKTERTREKEATRTTLGDVLFLFQLSSSHLCIIKRAVGQEFYLGISQRPWYSNSVDTIFFLLSSVFSFVRKWPKRWRWSMNRLHFREFMLQCAFLLPLISSSFCRMQNNTFIIVLRICICTICLLRICFRRSCYGSYANMQKKKNKRGEFILLSFPFRMDIFFLFFWFLEMVGKMP